jgi:uncharacterized protein
MNRLSRLSIRKSSLSLAYIVVPIIITLVMMMPLFKARINPDLNAYLPQGTPAKLNIEQVERHFGKYDPVLMIVEAEDVLAGSTLERLKRITDTLGQVAEIRDVVSLFQAKNIRGEEGAMIVDPAVAEIPQTVEERSLLRSELASNPLVMGLLVSEDFKFALVMINPSEGVPDDALFELLHTILAQYPGKEKVIFSGMPFLRYEIQRNATRDLLILLPLGLLVMIFFLYLSFREVRGVLLPFTVVVMSIVVAIGLMPLFGYELSLIAVLTPILMVAVANNYGVHLIARYQELNALHPDWTMREITRYAMKQLGKPIILTGLTTIVGVLGLVVHIMLPARQMGVVSAVGIAFALVLSITFLPAILVKLKKGPVRRSYLVRSASLVDRFLVWCGRIATLYPARVIVVFVVVFLCAGAGMVHLRVNINNEEMMPRSHPVRQATNVVNQSFGGTKYVSVLFEGDIKDPAVMGAMDDLGKRALRIPEVGNVTSLATVLRLMSKSLHNPGDPWYDTIPDSRAAIAQYIELYQMSGDPEDFEQLVDFEYEHVLVAIQFSAGNLQQFNRVIADIEEITNEIPASTLTAGLCMVEKEMAVSIAQGQIYSLLLALFAIVILLWFIFKSFRSGLLGAIPLLFTLGCNFGLMGWAGIELDIATSLLSSIAIGLGVDYTIHLFWRLRYELNKGKSWNEAVTTTLSTTGKGISVNAFSVILGFGVLFFSGLIILKSFAILIIFSLLLCLLCAMILVPAICVIARPGFLSKTNGTQLYSHQSESQSNQS